MVIRDLGRIEGNNAAAVQEHRVDLQRCPVVTPSFRVHGQRIAFVVVDLTAATQGCVPGD